LREAGKGVVVRADPASFCPLPVADPLLIVWSLIREILSPERVLCSIPNIKKPHLMLRRCGRETNGAQLFSLPYAGITQVRF